MSSRKVRKVRHLKSSPAFKALTKLAGDARQYLDTWKEAGFDTKLWGKVDPKSALLKFFRLPEAKPKNEHNHDHHDHEHHDHDH